MKYFLYIFLSLASPNGVFLNNSDASVNLAGSSVAPETDPPSTAVPVSRQIAPVNIDNQRIPPVTQGALPPGYEDKLHVCIIVGCISY